MTNDLNNIELMNLKFVDRHNEKEQLYMFLNNNYDSNILWIDGKSGYGKSYFIKSVYLNEKSNKNLNVYLEILKDSSKEHFDLFLEEIVNLNIISFKEFMRNNYKNIISSFSNAILKKINLDDFTTSALEGTLNFITKTNKKEDKTNMIISYIKSILLIKKVVIILDNFTVCDRNSLTQFTRLFQEFSKDNRIKFILITTNELLLKNEDLLCTLSEKLHINKLKIEELKNSSFFYDILSSKFFIENLEDNEINKLFMYCQGIPNKLKLFIRSLYFQDAIYEKDSLFYFNKTKFILELANKTLSFDIEKINDQFSLMILKIIAAWGTPITQNTLLKLIGSFYEIEYTIFKEEIIKKIQELKNLLIIKNVFINSNIYITFAHDSDYYAIIEILKNKDIEIQFLFNKIYSYVLLESTKDDCDFVEDLSYLKALHSYLAHAKECPEYNYDYAIKLQNQKKFYKANEIFARCEEYISFFTNDQLLNFAQNYYDIGNYEKSLSILNSIIPKNKNNAMYRNLLKLKAQVLTELLQPEEAIFIYKNLLKISNEHEKVEINCMLQSTLFRTPNQFKESEKIFKLYSEKYYDIPTNECPKYLSHLYRSAMNYLEGKESLKYLEKGQKLAEYYKNDEELAKIKHNIAFEEIRMAKYDDAIIKCKEAIRILDMYSPHEKAHTLNNLSVIYIITKKYNLAYEKLIESSFWNKSKFADYVIKTNLLILNYYLKNNMDEILLNNLLKNINISKNLDKKILKKVYYNVSWIYYSLGNKKKALEFLNKLKPYLDEEWEQGTIRFKMLYNKIINNHYKDIPVISHFKEYYIDIPFEPWLVTFNHD